jgi:aryl-alcohol dehydrogenase-like predicted oxidoreductase
MERRKINNTDLEITPLNFGGNVFGWTLDEKRSFEILDGFVRRGGNFIDTADTYSWWVNGTGGQSETIIGKWMKARGNRENVVIATKVGSQTQLHPADISRRHILKSVDLSLSRLQTDRIDLYYTHFDDGHTPVEETLAAYDEIIKAGKVRYIGASNLSAQRLEESFAVSEEKGYPRYVALQPLYNLMERQKFESEYAPLAERFGLGVFTYFSLAAGFLTGKYRSADDFSKSTRGVGAQKYLNEKGNAVLAALDEIAARHGAKPASVALAWLLSKPLVTAPIASATSESQLDDMFASLEVKLDGGDLDKLDRASQS